MPPYAPPVRAQSAVKERETRQVERARALAARPASGLTAGAAAAMLGLLPSRAAVLPCSRIPSIYIYLANAPATKPPRAVDYSSARPTRARRRRSSRCTHFKMPAAVLPERGASSQLRQAVPLYNRWHYIGLLKALDELDSWRAEGW